MYKFENITIFNKLQLANGLCYTVSYTRKILPRPVEKTNNMLQTISRIAKECLLFSSKFIFFILLTDPLVFISTADATLRVQDDIPTPQDLTLPTWDTFPFLDTGDTGP